MKFLRFIAATILLVVFTPETVPAGKTDQIQIYFPSGDYKIVSQETGHKIILEGYGYRMEPGKPMLPEKRFLIGMPPGAIVEDVVVEGLYEAPVPGVHRIVPAPPIAPLADAPRRRELTAQLQREWRQNNRAVYSSDNAYPNRIARLTGSGSLRQYAYASVSVCPFEYFPLSGRLIHYKNVKVTVRFKTVEGAYIPNNGATDKKAQELFVNFDEIEGLYSDGRESSIDRAPADTWDYVVITADTLASTVNSSSFVTWKTDLDYSVKTVTTSDTEITSQTGVDLAEKIRNFLRNYYGTWGIQYVLIVGDYTTVPMRYCFPDPADHSHTPLNYPNTGGSIPTDLYYADLSLPDASSWDLDGDGYHGEYVEDTPDFLVEVYVGRVPTSDKSRITYALAKMVGFEQDLGAWKQNALQPGSIFFYANQDFSGYPKMDGSTVLDLIETNILGGWTVSRYTERAGIDPSSFPWPAVSLAAFTSDWRTGQYGVVNWSGHGAPYGVGRTVWTWDDGDGVPETDGSDGWDQPLLIDVVCSLEDDYPSIVFAVSCNVGFPEPNGYGNLGIDLLTKPGFGAAAGIVNSSRPAYVTSDIILYPGGAEAVCYEFNRHAISLGQRLGEAMHNGKHYCYVNYGWEHYAEYANQYNFNFYGDPSMERILTPTGVNSRNPFGMSPAVTLLQNYPNPFNPSTEVAYKLHEDAQVMLEIFNPAGQLVAILVNEYQRAGDKALRWDGKNARGEKLASGVYFYRLRAGGVTKTRKMVLLK